MNESFFASFPGGQAVIDWFGFCPDFHDASLERIEVASGHAILAMHAFRTTSEVEAAGYFIRDRHELVTLRMERITGLKLEGDAGSIISELVIRRMHVSASPKSATLRSPSKVQSGCSAGFTPNT
ncbi:MAG TPA: hypothetical protein VM471_00570 [Phenylobacterium sp.]|jgi:hypothetical protein|nr:hypothetical protein [Phenylobacterium sp.]